MRCSIVRPLISAATALGLALVADTAAASTGGPDLPRIRNSSSERSGVFVSSGTRAAKAPTDTLYLYGGPGTDEGKFEQNGLPDRGGWSGVDATDLVSAWQISDFNAGTLNSNGTGNLAAWCGRSAVQEPGWVSAPGYGNGWNQRLVFEVDVADPGVGQVVDLDFYFHHDTEPTWDFFEVQYDSAGWFPTVYSVDGTDAVEGIFSAPGVHYAEQVTVPIVYDGNDYGFGGKIRIHLVVTSDGAWSDEDGLFDSVAGAVQVDDIRVTCSEGAYFEDFESDWTHWHPNKQPFAGDFFDVYPRFEDLDPCAENDTPVAGFLDYGQDVNNSASSALIPEYPTSTGGSTSVTWSNLGLEYGIPGSWVTNYTGGLSGGQVSLANWMVSPVIDWDLPGPEDDGVDYAGGLLRFDVYSHLPLLNGIFFLWSVRSGPSNGNGGVDWTDWADRNFVYYDGGIPAWRERNQDVADLLAPDREFVQIRLGVTDLALDFGFPGNDATPSPVFDNVAFLKYQVGGPVIVVDELNLPQDGFPVSGEIDASSQAVRDLLDVRFDSARDISFGTRLVPGDSVVVDFASVVPGATVVDRRMVWALEKNPIFEDAIRAVPARAVDQNVSTNDPTRWTGEVLGTQAVRSNGVPVEGQFFFDLPDEDFFYPGDRLRFYFQGTDSGGRVSTLPDDIAGFASPGLGYDATFEIRALPGIRHPQGYHPPVLFVDDSGSAQEEVVLRAALGALNMHDGEHYDTFTRRDPNSGRTHGIGAAGAHGATLAQIEGYRSIFYLSGSRRGGLLSDGSEDWPNNKGDDLGLLTDWHEASGMRGMASFGDHVAFGIANSGAVGYGYVQTILGVEVVGDDVADEIGGQTAPVVLPLFPLSGLFGDFVAYGGCPVINEFDSLRPSGIATRGHGFEMLGGGGVVYSDIAASVVHDRTVAAGRRIDLTFPYALQFVYARNDGPAGPARTALLAACLHYLGTPPPHPPGVDPPTRRVAELSVFPSPFNPRTVVSLVVPLEGQTEVAVFDLRGRRVRVLQRGELAAGTVRLNWDGTDESGAGVASGVYVVRAVGEGFELQKKAVLLK